MIGRYALLVTVSCLIRYIQLLRRPLCLRKKEMTRASLATSNVALHNLCRRSGMAQKAAGLAFLFELPKGFLPTFSVYPAPGRPSTVGGRSAVLVGNYLPHFVRPCGSNSLAPLLRVLIAVYPIGAVMLGMTWTAAWRYAPLAALVTATTSLPLALDALEAKESYEKALVLAAVSWSILIFFAQRENIRRPIGKQEARVDAPLGGEDGRGRRRVP